MRALVVEFGFAPRAVRIQIAMPRQEIVPRLVCFFCGDVVFLAHCFPVEPVQIVAVTSGVRPPVAPTASLHDKPIPAKCRTRRCTRNDYRVYGFRRGGRFGRGSHGVSFSLGHLCTLPEPFQFSVFSLHENLAAFACSNPAIFNRPEKRPVSVVQCRKAFDFRAAAFAVVVSACPRWFWRVTIDDLWFRCFLFHVFCFHKLLPAS